jgi:hypothetical protein
MGKKTKRIILIDADVVSHFIKAGEIYSINNIFPNEIKILDKAYKELEKHAGKKIQIDNLINQKIIDIYQFPEGNQDIKKEYFSTSKTNYLREKVKVLALR